jgi:hypothetical protein
MIVMKVLVSSLVLLVACQLGLAQGADGYADLVEELMPSIVLVNTYDSAGNALKRGTGFCVAPNLFITNYHVIEGASRITVATSDNRKYFMDTDSVNKSADLVLLKSGSETNVRPLKFTAGLPKVGDRIVVVGNPLGLTGTVSDGIVSAIRDAGEEYVQITAPISPGSSGSPVINLRGDVIGVATLNLKGGQNLNFAISSRYIQNLWPSKFVIASTATNTKVRRSSRWRLLNNDDTTYDKQTLSKTGEVVSVWINYNEKDGTEEKVFSEMNCANRKFRRVQAISYDSKGNVTRSSDVSGDWQAIIPDSNGERYFEIFCNGRPDFQSETEFYDFVQTAETYEKENNLPAAIEAWWNAIHLGYELRKSGALISLYLNWIVVDNLEKIYKKQNDTEGLERLFTFGISKGDFERHSDLAALYKKLGATAKFRSTTLAGIKILEDKVISTKRNWSDYLTLAELYVLRDQPLKAIAKLVDGMGRFPNNEFLASSLGTLYNENKRYIDCVGLIKKVLPNAKYLRRDLLTLLKTAYVGLGDKINVVRIDAELKDLK